MEHTKHYSLPQWEKSDRIMMEDFNQAMENIDAGIVGVASEGAAALAAAVGSGGHNCRVICGSYTGSGKYGETNPNKLDFGFYPVLVIVGSAQNCTSAAWPTIMLRGVGASNADNSQSLSTISVIWTNTGVKWWNYYNAENQNNGKIPYYYMAIGYTQ